jgi:hypothetical protein
VAFCGSQGSGTALAHRILYLHSWPTALSNDCGLVGSMDLSCVCVCSQNKEKSSRQVRGL